MATPVRHILPAFLLLVLGWVGVHAAEHEGWIHGVLHSHACDHQCPDDGAPCADRAHHDACLCHAHGDTLPCVEAQVPAAKPPSVARAPEVHFVWVSLAVVAGTVFHDAPWLPPPQVGSAVAPLLL